MPKCCCCCSCCAFANFIAKFCYYWPQKKTTKSRSRTRKQRNGTVAMKHSGLNGKRKKLFLFHRNEKKSMKERRRKNKWNDQCARVKSAYWSRIGLKFNRIPAKCLPSLLLPRVFIIFHFQFTWIALFPHFTFLPQKCTRTWQKNNNSRHKFCCFFVFVSKWLSQFQITTPMSMCLCGCVSVSTFSLTVYLLHKFVVEWFKNADHIFQRQLEIAFALFVNGQNIEIF